MEHIYCEFANMPSIQGYIPDNDIGMIPGNSIKDIYLDYEEDVNTFYEPNYHKFGFQHHLYYDKTPMAWEITKGKNNVVIGMIDNWKENYIPDNPDLQEIHNINDWSQSAHGYFLRIQNENYNTNPPYNDGSSYGDGLSNHSTGYFTYGHGVSVSATAFAQGANGKISGTCLNCSGLIFSVTDDPAITLKQESNPWIEGTPESNKSFYYRSDDYLETDTDLELNGKKRLVSVLNSSNTTGSRDDYFNISKLIKSGIIYVAIAYNGPWGDKVYPASNVFVNTFDPYDYDSDRDNQNSDPDLDYKVICVAGTDDGVLDCKNTPPYQYFKGLWKGSEKFADRTDDPTTGSNWSLDKDKFDRENSMETVKENNVEKPILKRRNSKEKAFVDICAPFEVLTVTSGGYPFLEHDYERFYKFVEGTSFSGPQVSGICALMVSINKFFRMPYDESKGTVIGDGSYVQRKAYDILTFTSDKVMDGSTDPDPEYQPEYKTQDDVYENNEKIYGDKIKRSWAQRMGFGRVNAYRAVAHAIENKGAYEYTSSTPPLPFAANDGGNPPDARGYVNEDGKMLMHFGSKVKEGTGLFEISISRGPDPNNNDGILDVLDWGGSNKPDDAFFYWEQYDVNNPHNNQGMTKLNNSSQNVILSVSDNCILAIDGILFSDQNNKQHQIQCFNTTTSLPSNGKILTTGYMQDVRLKGNLKVSDLFIKGTNNETAGLLFIDEYETENLISEIYGHVVLLDNAFLTVDACTTEVQPGGIIEMSGNKDIIVQNGGVLRLNGATSINGTSPRKILVKSGSKLIVNENAKTELLTKVEVEDGGEFIIMQDAVVKLNEFLVHIGGSISIAQGSWVSLNQNIINECKGFFSSIGTSDKRITISGRVIDCCRDICTEVDQPSKINLTGTPPNWTRSRLTVNFTDFDNVLIKGLNMAVSPIISCKFLANSHLNSSSGAAPVLLYLNNWDLIGNTLANTFTLTDCDFRDKDLGIIESVPVTNQKFIGLRLDYLKHADISFSRFNCMTYSIYYENCNYVWIHENEYFKNFVNGTCNFASKSYINDNYFIWGKYGSGFVSSMPGSIKYNRYNMTYHCIEAWESDKQFLCYNTFNEWARGIYSHKSKLILGLEFYPWDPSYYRYGKNEFNLFWDEHYVKSPDYIDIDFDDEGSIYLWDGRNKFAINSDYHLKGLYGPIRVRGNEWRPESFGVCTVRSNGLTLLDELELCNSSGDACVVPSDNPAIVNVDTCIGIYGYLVDGHYVWNVGKWTVESFTPEQWQDIIDQAIDYIGDSLNINCKCKIQILHDLMEAIELSNDQSEETYQKLSDLFAHTKYWCNSSDLSYWIIFGLLFEYFDKLDDADDIYSDIVTNYTTFTYDSIAANWRLLELNAIRSDTTYGALYDSLISIYYNRILADLDRFPYQYSDTMMHKDSIHYRRPQDVEWNLESSTTLGQNIPNPFSDETEIPFYLKKPEFVKLVVYDAFGREIAVLVNEYRQPGKHSAIYRSPNLYNGVYFYRLEAGGIIETRKMQLIR